MSQSTIPVFGHDYAKVRVPAMWNNKMLAIQGLLNAIPSEWEDPVDSYRWLDQYDQLHYEAECIWNYAQGMGVTVPELPEAIQDLMAATDLAIAKLCEWVSNNCQYEDDNQGSGNDDNAKALENLKGPCKECSEEGRGDSCEGELQQACL
ncbi:hypothetical protein EDC04DRAFT_2603461 [Pisolithus marmoratus]|nr:hypothetical protein EDC04DRAFT_2603461 [Pisolithus marmoratus]